MNAQDLQNSILQLSIQGKLVKQDPNDESASILLEKIEKGWNKMSRGKKGKREKHSKISKNSHDRHYYEMYEDGLTNDITEEIPFDIPDKWEWCRINNIANVYNGNSISKDVKEKKYSNVKEGYNYIATKDVGFDHKIDYDNGIRIPYTETKFRIAYKNSPLLCLEGGSAGKKIAFATEDICFGNKLATFETYLINSKYLYYFLQSPYLFQTFKSNVTGIIGGINIGKLRQLLIPIPPLEEQYRIVNKIEKLFSCIDI